MLYNLNLYTPTIAKGCQEDLALEAGEASQAPRVSCPAKEIRFGIVVSTTNARKPGSPAHSLLINRIWNICITMNWNKKLWGYVVEMPFMVALTLAVVFVMVVVKLAGFILNFAFEPIR
ncbi:MAG: hypothetical protein SFY81_14710 [Verrucomicrobiota bacterium]|nr:hypothetical protein [Verrucomicrobiota bacterium]